MPARGTHTTDPHQQQLPVSTEGAAGSTMRPLLLLAFLACCSWPAAAGAAPAPSSKATAPRELLASRHKHRLQPRQHCSPLLLSGRVRGGAAAQRVPYTDKRGLGPGSTSTGVRPEAEIQDDTPKYAEAFLLRDSRIGFIRKVYLCLTCQLVATAAAVVLATRHKATLLPWLSTGRHLDWAFFGSFGASFVALTALERRAFGRRLGPTSALLALFTLTESVMVSIIAMMYKAKSVYLVLGQTAVATLGLSAYAFQNNPKYDLTGVGQALASSLLVLLMFSLLRLFIPSLRQGTQLLYSSLGAAIFSLFIVYDTQRVIGGKHRTSDQIDRKDWALGSVALYVDIVQLFLYLLQLFGQREE